MQANGVGSSLYFKDFATFTAKMLSRFEHQESKGYGGAAIKAAQAAGQKLALLEDKNMQTKLRMAVVIFAASLLSASLISAASLTKATSVKPKGHIVGIASWYGLQHQGLKMANGKRFDRRKLTAASWYVPLGTALRVVNLENGRSVTVTVTDRGPNLRLHRIVDLSEAAARELGYVEKGLARVYVSPVESYAPQHAELRRPLVEPDAALVATVAEPPALLPAP